MTGFENLFTLKCVVRNLLFEVKFIDTTSGDLKGCMSR
jgi:hypothetical protein